MMLSRWCIDGNWRSRTAAVESYAKQSPYASVITITQGRGVKASENPFSQAQRALKWKTGPGWFWVDDPGAARWVTFDTNLWKKRVHEGLSMGVGSRGSIQLFSAPPHVHQMLADHLRSEKPIKNESNGRTVYEWQEKPGQDNEGLDSLVGCAIGASIEKIQRASERRAEAAFERLSWSAKLKQKGQR
jgi:phage terminase large subunit GpA-like protein